MRAMRSGSGEAAMPGPPPRVALATCAEFPELDTDSRTLLSYLADLGVAGVAGVWSDASIDWQSFDLVVIRCCWDYFERRDQFLAWAGRVEGLANPAATLAWNTDKTYLGTLAAQGIAIAPTEWLTPDTPWALPDRGLWVIKPNVSLCALGTGRYDLADENQRQLAAAHIVRLHGEGRTVMLQPYLHAIDTEGETSMVFLDGEFSHAVRKPALLDGPDRGIDRRFISAGDSPPPAHVPSDGEFALADRVLAAVPGGRRSLLYARVDLTSGPDGSPFLMEMELTEPQLFLAAATGAFDRFAAAIADRAAGGAALRRRFA